MKVSELIEILKKLKPDNDIKIRIGENLVDLDFEISREELIKYSDDFLYNLLLGEIAKDKFNITKKDQEDTREAVNGYKNEWFVDRKIFKDDQISSDKKPVYLLNFSQ